MPDALNILVFGGGSVGLGLAGSLIKAGARVAIVGRDETTRALREQGLLLTGIFGDHAAPPASFTACASLADAPARPYDFILVCVKSTDTRDAARTLWDHRDRFPNTRIILCQNGWGNAEIFQDHWPRKQVCCARIITGFRRPAPWQVDITVHADAIHIGHPDGAIDPDLEQLCAAIDTGGIPCRPTTTITADLWAKMLYNCALNPLGAVLGVPYGRLGEIEETRQFMNQLIHETFAVMEAAGHATHWPSAGAYLEVFYASQLPATYAHESSMLQDLRAHRQTEIDALTGQVITLGATHHVPTPYSQSLYWLVKAVEPQEA